MKKYKISPYMQFAFICCDYSQWYLQLGEAKSWLEIDRKCFYCGGIMISTDEIIAIKNILQLSGEEGFIHLLDELRFEKL